MGLQEVDNKTAVLESLMAVGVNLSLVEDRQTMLEMILHQARKLTAAEAGALYVLVGQTLQFVAVQNDGLADVKISEELVGRELPVGKDSLAGFVASVGEVINIPDSCALPPGTPFRIDRQFDAATGYRTKSILAVPLMRPNGQCVGVLQLINRLGPGGSVQTFPDEHRSGITSLASMAAVTIHNTILQEQLKKAQLECIIRLSVAAEFRDADTADHIRRISYTSAMLAAGMGMDRKQVELLKHASPMHDIGKIGIPDSILRKRGPLNPQEREIVKRHARIGADILADPQNNLIAMAYEVALTHHEQWDGQGYPKGLAGEDIPLCGRVVHVADVFDALVTRRCYKEAYSPAKAIEIIHQQDGKHFDPNITQVFMDRLDVILSHYGFAQ